MNKYTQTYANICQEMEKTILTFLDRPLRLKEQNALRNAGSLMMLESFERGIESVKNKEQAENELKEILKLNRLPDFLDHFCSNMDEKGIDISTAAKDKIITSGNILDIMNLWDKIEGNNLNQSQINKAIGDLLSLLDKRTNSN